MPRARRQPCRPEPISRVRASAFRGLDLVRVCCALAAFVCAACGGANAFTTRFPDNRESDLERLLERINAAPARPASTVAAAVSSAPKKLYAFDLSSRRVLWQQPLDATSAPHLAGNVVVIQAGASVVGHDSASGARVFSVDVGDMRLKGADGEGSRVAFVVGSGQGTYARSQALLVEGGSLRWRAEIDSQAGSPAVVGTMVLVPWSTQYLTALDATTGHEFARVRVRDGVISHAFREGSDVFVGSHNGVARVTSAIGSGSIKSGGYFTLPDRALPGRPLLLTDLYMSEQALAPESAQHRITLAWDPIVGPEARLALRDGNLYLIFYRFAFALDPKTYAVRWVYPHDADIVGATAQPGGLAFSDEAGGFGFIGAASGALAWRDKSGLSTTVAALPRDGGGGDTGPAISAAGLRARMLAAAQDTDARLVPARLFVVEQLAAADDADATANLIALCDDERLAPPVRKEACDVLKDREIGADHLLIALQRHAAYLEGTTTPPVGALARAAASQQVKQAVPLLIAHLNDPNTASRDLPALVTALRELGDPAAAEPLGDFLRLYHADPIDEHLVRALELIPDALVALSGPVAKPTVEGIAKDGLSSDGVRDKALAALQTLVALEEAARKEEEQKHAAQEEKLEEETAPAAPVDLMPERLTLDVVSKALLPVRDQLQGCLVDRPQPLFQGRVVLVVEDGQVLMVSVLPQELQGCVEPLIRAQPFPETKLAKREQITYTLKRN